MIPSCPNNSSHFLFLYDDRGSVKLHKCRACGIVVEEEPSIVDDYDFEYNKVPYFQEDLQDESIMYAMCNEHIRLTININKKLKTSHKE